MIKEKMQRGGTVYILTNNKHSVLYTGVTSNLIARVLEHKEKVFIESFTSRYNVHKLVFYNSFSTIEEAISEEKRIKGGNRAKKIALINAKNPEWKDLFEEIKHW